MLHPVIMAGGSGTRFWPASRNTTPKQLLSLVPGGTMIAQTVERLGDLASPERCLVITNARLVEAIREQFPRLRSWANPASATPRRALDSPRC
jgi:mannose-1-phosphate guanylyltransferase